MSLSNVDYVGYESKWFHIRNAIPKSQAFPPGVTNGCRVVTRVTLGVANQPRNVQVHTPHSSNHSTHHRALVFTLAHAL